MKSESELRLSIGQLHDVGMLLVDIGCVEATAACDVIKDVLLWVLEDDKPC